MNVKKQMIIKIDLEEREKAHYRDLLRSARYSALADAEGFGEICYAIEALGLRLLKKQGTMGEYKSYIKLLAEYSPIFNDLPKELPNQFTQFSALYATVNSARNDVMHTGAYARHATQAGIELCIGLEDALMHMDSKEAKNIKDVMVKFPMTVEEWQPVGRARQLMLMHSFSFLPILHDNRWKLISELGLAKYLSEASLGNRKDKMAQTLNDAITQGMQVVDNVPLLKSSGSVEDLLSNTKVQDGPMLWLVVESDTNNNLVGVLSPFELM